jgi:hypothetical protein
MKDWGEYVSDQSSSFFGVRKNKKEKEEEEERHQKEEVSQICLHECWSLSVGHMLLGLFASVCLCGHPYCKTS